MKCKYCEREIMPDMVTEKGCLWCDTTSCPQCGKRFSTWDGEDKKYSIYYCNECDIEFDSKGNVIS